MESKARASTRIPIDLAIDSKDNNFKPTNIISMNKNCLTHSDGLHNETVMKAFKMACLNYEPSTVEFENNIYKRKDLIEAKSDLLKYCLSQLKHLDLSLIDQKMHA